MHRFDLVVLTMIVANCVLIASRNPLCNGAETDGNIVILVDMITMILILVRVIYLSSISLIRTTVA